MTDIDVMVRSANPVPDDSQQLADDELSAVLLLAQQRSGNMDVKELTKPVQEDRPNRPGWLIAALAFVAIIVVVGAAMVLTGDATEDLTPATTPPTTAALPPTTAAPIETIEEPAEEPVEPPGVATDTQLAIIKAYEDAVNSGDAVRIASMLESGFRYTDESTVGQGWFDSAERWTNVQMVHVLEGSAVSYTDCEVDGEAISCLETWTGPIPRAMTGGDWTYRADFILDNPTDGDTWAGVESLHGVALAWPDAAVAMAFYEGMVDWASEVEPELAPVLGTCVIDAGNQDLEVWPVCVEWVERWLEAGRP